MLLGDCLPVKEEEDQNNPTEGSASIKMQQEILPKFKALSTGNTLPTGLIKVQPLPNSQGAAGLRRPQCDSQKPNCPRCGFVSPDQRTPTPPLSLSQVQGSSLSVHSSGGRRNRTCKSKLPIAKHSDGCFHLLLACLSCQCSMLFLGLLDSCSSCVHGLCASCCHACARCCSAIQEVPVEELSCHTHCHSVLFESCCEPTECLEFCLECCDICHRS
ncbi:myoD family inhibitor domain-containing protein-like [Echeneis naucrates]|uniref:myoD family inhibitor domain-containing protein-like n=1 Tax=Echeneis naucrates TaxID=173247 RepID=UPI001113AC6B|nr:myoD family inhibitor domain-containing protein-like [Echeneis naucrates]